MPIEVIFRVQLDIDVQGNDKAFASKKTYRNAEQAERARQREEEERKRDKWTVGGVLEARALDKGFSKLPFDRRKYEVRLINYSDRQRGKTRYKSGGERK